MQNEVLARIAAVFYLLCYKAELEGMIYIQQKTGQFQSVTFYK